MVVEEGVLLLLLVVLLMLQRPGVQAPAGLSRVHRLAHVAGVLVGDV